MFGADVKVGDEYADVQGPTKGLSAHGKNVNLENARLELADPADSSKLVIAAHEDGAPGHFTATPADGFEFATDETSVPVPVKYRADGRPGEGEVTIEDDGIIVLKAPDAATFSGDVTATTTPVA